MSVWIKVFNPTYTLQLGDGPIFLESVTVNRALDEIGDCSISLSGLDIRAISLIEPRRVIEIWHDELDFTKRKVGTFVVEGETNSDSDTKSLTISGRSSALTLADKLVLSGSGTIYQAETVNNVASAVCGFAGWTANIDGSIASDLISVAFNDDKVFRALQTLAEIKGAHLRESETVSKQIDIGVFGTNDDNIHIEWIEGDSGEIQRRSESPMLLERATISRESSDIWNWAKVFAGGDGDAALDISLAMATRGFIDAVSANGKTHYIIKDNASISNYGQIEKRIDIQRIVPVANTDSALVAAAEAAADAAKATLDRHSEPQTIISVSLRNVRQTISPGDKVHLTYKGVMNKSGIPYKYRDIDDDFWVMSATEQISSSGVTLVLELSNIDRYKANAAGIIVGMMDDIQVQKLDVKPYPSIMQWGPFQQPIDTATSVTFKFPILDNVLRLNSVIAYISRDNWTAVASGAAAGGSDVNINIPPHHHIMFDNILAAAVPTANKLVATTDGSGVGITVGLYVNSNVTTIRTAQAAGSATLALPDHTHDPEFSDVKKDNLKPSGLDITVNGDSVATGLFPDDGGQEYIDADIVQIDITDAVTNKAGGFRAWHAMEIECGADRGDISVVFQINVDIGKVRTSS